MKDIVHHLRHVQKKVVQEARKNGQEASLNGKEHNQTSTLVQSAPPKKDLNRQPRRVLKRIGFH